MKIRFENKDNFAVQGYAVETILNSCENDVGQLWTQHKDTLLAIQDSRLCLFGVMWYTNDHKYFYLLGIQSDKPLKSNMISVDIPAAHFAVATVPKNMSEIEAWTQFFDIELPSFGYAPDAEHGKYFEFHNADGACELWTPVKKLSE